MPEIEKRPFGRTGHVSSAILFGGAAVRAVHWLLAQPGLFLNSVGDVDLLPAVLKAAATGIEMPAAAAMAAHSERTGLSSIFGI